MALNVVCCETAIGLESAGMQKYQARAQNVADDPNSKFRDDSRVPAFGGPKRTLTNPLFATSTRLT
jgi:hypothetical protein